MLFLNLSRRMRVLMSTAASSGPVKVRRPLGKGTAISRHWCTHATATIRERESCRRTQRQRQIGESTCRGPLTSRKLSTVRPIRRTRRRARESSTAGPTLFPPANLILNPSGRRLTTIATAHRRILTARHKIHTDRRMTTPFMLRLFRMGHPETIYHPNKVRSSKLNYLST